MRARLRVERRRLAMRVAFAGLRGRAAAVPPCPDGWFVGPPDFVGVGTMKSGTSWWYTLVASHPDVTDVPDRAKEIHFFDRAPWETTNVDDYHRYFPRLPGQLVGEWTPRYMYDVSTPAMLHRAAPDARLLVLVRDPVDRLVSGIAHDLRSGMPRIPIVLQDQFARGLYIEQLDRLFRHWEPERVLVLQYERCVADPAAMLAATYEFLGLDRPFTPANLREHVLRTSEEKPVFDRSTIEAIVAAYRPSVELLLSRFPQIDVDLWPNFSS